MVGLASHDFRDLGPEVEEVRDMIDRAQKSFPEVPYRFCRASEAFQRSMNLPIETTPPLELTLELDLKPVDDVPNITIKTSAGKVFGPQPFLAIETKGQRFIHDNLDFDIEDGTWFYAFHSDTLPFDDVRRIGIGANDSLGRSFVKVVEIA